MKIRPIGPLVRLTLIAAGLAGWAHGQNQDLVDQLIGRIVAGEQDFLERIAQYEPLIETYIQEIPSPQAAQSLLKDHYMLGRARLDDGVSFTPYALTGGFARPERKGKRWLPGKPAAEMFIAEGFAQMIVLDAFDFNSETYAFDYVRREFLGEVRTLVFDVAPRHEAVSGKFVGRIWVEDRDYRIVRFNGTYTLRDSEGLFFHFDSWRVNVEPGFWVPAVVYVEDAGARGPNSQTVSFRGQTRLWGYHQTNESKLDELSRILVETEQGLDDSTSASDPSPVESRRSWRRQAEENIIERLERAGLLAPRGEVDEVLDTVVANLMVTNGIHLDAHCRVLLTTPLETFSIGEAIVISRGLLDVLPDEASLAMVLSGELAHIALGHRTETMFAFSDRTMFADHEILDRLRLSRDGEENGLAGRKAIEILSRSPYKDQLSTAGLFLKVLTSRAGRLENLIRANLGNRWAGEEQRARLASLIEAAPELEEENIEQIAALPLGSRTKLDPWTNRLVLLPAKPVVLHSAKDKIPFEVTPFALHLTRLPGETETPPSSQTARNVTR